MSTSSLQLPLSLNLTQHTRWTVAQESALQSHPFSTADDGDSEAQHEANQNVVRVYLQFLWLPESIMPLSLFVPAIASAAPPASLPPTSPHPLHSLLEPLMMTTRATSNKYHVDLPQILVDGGGAGEIEEQMMWFTLSFETGDGDDGGAHRHSNTLHGEGGDEESEPWRNEQWRKAWLERMERREAQIQVLLHFLKLSLPGPAPSGGADKPTTSAKAHKRHYFPNGVSYRHAKKQTKNQAPALSTRDSLEVYMDKLSTWQLLNRINTPVADVNNQSQGNVALASNGKGDERDWIQIFVEDVVDKQFRSYVPDLCDLFREKVFPTSFSDPSDGENFEEVGSLASTRSNSPAEADTATSLSRSVSTLFSSESKSGAHAGQSRLSRSRSLSVSLQQERESQRDASHQQKNKKRTMNREVSMSRVFRAKSKGPTPGPEHMGLTFGVPSGLSGRETKHVGNDKGKAKAAYDKSQAEITFVQATPAKNRMRSLSTMSTMGVGKGSKPKTSDVRNDADIWESELPKSGDVIVQTGGGEDDDEVVLVAETPQKVKSRTKPKPTLSGRL